MTAEDQPRIARVRKIHVRCARHGVHLFWARVIDEVIDGTVSFEFRGPDGLRVHMDKGIEGLVWDVVRPRSEPRGAGHTISVNVARRRTAVRVADGDTVTIPLGESAQRK